MRVKTVRLQSLILSILVVLVIVSTVPFVLSYETSTQTMNQPLGDFTVPSWIKNNAGWWAGDLIDDSAFVSGIQWLISNDIMTLPPTEQGVGDVENIIPKWVKNSAGWWAEDKIHDITFVAAIKYLIGEGIIIIEQEVEEVEESVEEVEEVEESVEEVEEVKDFYMRVNSGDCCQNWAYSGMDWRFQIETFDEYRGNYIDGVELNLKILSKDGELRRDIGEVITNNGIYLGRENIPGTQHGSDWYGDNILSIVGKYIGVEKTIEKEFVVFLPHNNYTSTG